MEITISHTSTIKNLPNYPTIFNLNTTDLLKNMKIGRLIRFNKRRVGKFG